MALLFLIVGVAYSIETSFGLTIELPECEPPDFPLWGGYGPRQDFYAAGDVIHYYCDTDTHIGGNYYRRCEDTGDWTGESPVCDSPSPFKSTTLTSTADPEDENGADMAVDGLRSTCFSTREGPGNSWVGMLATSGLLFRVMVFLPKTDVAYEVMMIKRNGDEYSCGARQRYIDSLNWEFHNCPEPNNTGVVGIRIKSLSSSPLQVCEVVAHSLTDPTCVDPRVRIENGRLQLSRKTATLVCGAGYTKSSETRLDCIRTGVWNRKFLACLEMPWEVIRGTTPDVDP